MFARQAEIRFPTLLGRREVLRKPKKPPDILYGVEDTPPASALLLSACQHVSNLALSVVIPVAIFRLAHVPAEVATSGIGIGFLVLALASILQALPRGPVGSGYLAPSCFAAVFIIPSVAALNLGGFPLMCGMTVFSGAVQAALSRAVRHLRPFLPPEIAGTVTFLLGINGGLLGLRDMLGLGLEGAVPQAHYVVGAFTLGLIIVLNVWTSGLLRMACVLIGLVVGYGAALATGLVPLEMMTANPEKLLAVPRFGHLGLSFDVKLTLPFLVAGVISAVKSMAVVTACQRTNDAAYVRPDLATMNRGVLADGLVTALSGFLGTAGCNLSPSSPGLAAATGVTSRRVAYAIAALLALMAFSPAAAAVFAAIPDAVAGPILVFSSCFVITSGVEVLASRLLDSRRMLVIAGAILTGTGAETLGRANGMPEALHQITASPLLLGTVVAFVLNLVFRPGTKRNSVMTLDAGSLDLHQLHEFMDARGAAWGARPDAIKRAGFALAELVESVVQHCRAQGPIQVAARFNEFRIDLVVTYQGALMPFPFVRPTLDDIADSPDALVGLSGFMVRRQTDGVRAAERNGRSVVEMSFDH